MDGYSRFPIYLVAANNNKSATVMQIFQTGVDNHGLPEHVRMDMGTENVQVARYMISRKGSNNFLRESC